MADLYSVSDIVGKTLIANTRVPYYASANDSAAPLGYVNAGYPVGVVYSWLDPNPAYNRVGLWWIFQKNGSFIYAPQRIGLYNIGALNQQGVISTEEKIKQEQEAARIASMGVVEQYIYKYGKYILFTAIAIGLGAAVIKKKL